MATRLRLSGIYRDARGGAGPCPGSDELWALATGELRGRRRDAVLAHVARCRDCASDVKDVLRSGLSREARHALPARPASRPSRQALAAAALLLATAGITLLYRPGPPPAGPMRGSSARPSRVEAISPAPGEQLRRAPAELAFRPVEGADAYDVDLMDASATTLLQRRSMQEARAALPEDVRRRLDAGGTFMWRVVVVRGLDRLPGPVFRFTVTPVAAPR